MAIELHGPESIAAMRRAGSVAAATLREVGSRLVAGITTAQIDRWVREDTTRRGARPSQLGVRQAKGPPFPAAVCVSRNQVVCHGVPSAHERLAEGDIVNLDVTSELGGFHGDTSATFMIGVVDAERRELTLHPVGLRVLADGWTVVTEDGSPSAQFEHTLLVTEQGYEVLTLADEPIS